MENFNSLSPAQQEAILHGPAMAPPPGVKPNYDDPPNRNGVGLFALILCLAVSTVCVFIRVYSRLFCLKKVTVEDALGLAGVAGQAALIWSSFAFMDVAGGYFGHQWNVQLIQMSKVSYILFIIPQMYSITLLFLKTAILLEWIRIFVPHHTRNWFFWTCSGVATANVLLYVASIGAANFYCIPKQKIWDRWIEGRCLHRKAIDAPPAVFNLVFDIVILLLPQKIIWNLQMSFQRKIGISVLFSVGLLACACAAGRFISTMLLDYAGDVIYDVSSAVIWGLAECTCVLMVFCFPSFPKAFADMGALTNLYTKIKSWASSNSRSSKGGWGSGYDRGHAVIPARPSASSSAYQKMIDDAHSQEVPLTKFDNAASGTDYNQANVHFPDRTHANDSILRVTDITSVQAPASEDTKNTDIKRQHPWAGDIKKY